jgi:7-cyano-7-deazaguanine synthase
LVVEGRRGRKGFESVCVLVSGGADSGILLAEMTREYRKVIPLYIRNGLLWEGAELYWLRQFLKRLAHTAIQPLQTLELPMQDVYQIHWSLTGQEVPDKASAAIDVCLPGRNLILLSKTVVFCALNGIHAVALGPLKANPFSDSSPRFFTLFGKVVEQGLGTRLEILTPFARRQKAEVLQLGRQLPLELTFSCLKPQGTLHCGVCNKCAERISAFKEAGLPDHATYHRQERMGKSAALSTNGPHCTHSRPRRATHRSRRVPA